MKIPVQIKMCKHYLTTVVGCYRMLYISRIIICTINITKKPILSIQFMRHFGNFFYEDICSNQDV